jgi:hypothetical protein
MEEKQDNYFMINKVKKNSNTDILLPKEIYERVILKGKNVLSVVTDRKLVMFPTNAETGLYMKAFIKRKKSGLDDTFFIALRTETAKFELKTLFTTGVCFSKEECFWEGIFEFRENFPLKDFIDEINKIESVISVKTKILTTNF